MQNRSGARTRDFNLVVDRDPIVGQQLVATLEGLGREVLAAYGGVEAREKARHFRPVIVVLDVMVQDLGGVRGLPPCSPAPAACRHRCDRDPPRGDA